MSIHRLQHEQIQTMVGIQILYVVNFWCLEFKYKRPGSILYNLLSGLWKEILMSKANTRFLMIWYWESITHWAAKNAIHGNLRSWVSTKTFCTKTFGEQLCCNHDNEHVNKHSTNKITMSDAKVEFTQKNNKTVIVHVYKCYFISRSVYKIK